VGIRSNVALIPVSCSINPFSFRVAVVDPIQILGALPNY
jgi:hypothetical protein